MIICNSTRVIFLEVPKTGSYSLSALIRKSDFFNNKIDTVFGQHTTISKAIDEQALQYDISEYSIYAFIRNPLDRVLSAWNHAYVADQKNSNSMNFNQIKDNFTKSVLNGFIDSYILKLNQSHFYEEQYNVNVLLFEDYNNEMTKVFKSHNIEMPSIPVKNVRRGEKSLITVENMYTEETIRYVEYKYKQDIALWQELNEKLK